LRLSNKKIKKIFALFSFLCYFVFMIKIIFLDLDGTLLDDKKQVPAENLKWIQKAYTEKGVISVIATGRPLCYAQQISGLGNAGSYVIACNGAIIKNLQTDEYLLNALFTNEEVLKIRDIFLQESADYLTAYTENNALVEEKKEGSYPYPFDKSDSNAYRRKVENLEKELKNQPASVFRCVIGGNKETVLLAKEKVDKLDWTESILMLTNKDYKDNVDITRAGCNKQNAIRKIIDKLQIRPEEVMAMGDSENDLPMFELAGIKIAMQNAKQPLKEKADYITADNNHSGVAQAIRKLIFNEK